MAPLGVALSYLLAILALGVTLLLIFSNISLPSVGVIESFIKGRELLIYGIGTGVAVLSSITSILMIFYTNSRQHMIGNKRTLLLATTVTILCAIWLISKWVPFVMDFLVQVFG